MSNLYAIVENGVVTNVIVWNGNTDVKSGGWQPPAGSVAVQIQPQPEIDWTAAQGSDGTWVFSPPVQ